MQATDLTTSSTVIPQPPNATLANFTTPIALFGTQSPSQAKVGSAPQQPRKRGRPPTKNRQSLPGSDAHAIGTPTLDGSGNLLAQCPESTNVDKGHKRSRRIDNHELLIVPFEYGWTRIVRFRWQAPAPHIIAEVTYKSPNGKILRSYAKVGEFLSADNNASQDGPTLTPENFTFSSRTRIPGTTYQKTMISAQGHKEYREMANAEVDLLLTTMNESARSRSYNPVPVYERIFGQTASTETPQFEVVNLSAGATNNLAENAGVANRVNERTKLFSPSPLTNTSSSQGVPINANAVAGADEQQAMLMFMTAAMYMQQHQQHMQQQSLPKVEDMKPNVMNSPVAKGKQVMTNVMTSLDLQAETENNQHHTPAEFALLNLARSQFDEKMTSCTAATVADQSVANKFDDLAAVVTKTALSPVAVPPQPTPKIRVDREQRRIQREKKFQQERKAKLAELKHELQRQPVDDMLLIHSKPVPELTRFARHCLLKTSRAVADCFQAFEFVQTFAEALGLDVNGLPSLGCLESGLAGSDRQALLEVTDLLCRLVAIGLQVTSAWSDGPVAELARCHPDDVDLVLWEELPKLPIDRWTISEATRHFLKVRHKGRVTEEVEMLSNNMFQLMNPTARSRVLAAVCDELLSYDAVLSEIENSLHKSVELKRDLLSIESQIKSLNSSLLMVNASPAKSDGDAVKSEEDKEEQQINSNGVVMEESAKKITADMKKASRQEKTCRSRLQQAVCKIRGLLLGFDRFNRCYWALPHLGALIVHGSNLQESEDDSTAVEDQVQVEVEKSENPTNCNDVASSGSSSSSSSSSISEDSDNDEIEGVRLSPPREMQAQQAMMTEAAVMRSPESQMAPSSNPRRGRKSSQKPRKCINGGVPSEDNGSAMAAVDLSAGPPAPAAENVVTIDPAVVFQNFLMLAKQLQMSSIGQLDNAQAEKMIDDGGGGAPPSAFNKHSHAHQNLKVHFEDEAKNIAKEVEVKSPTVTTMESPRKTGDAQPNGGEEEIEGGEEEEEEEEEEDEAMESPSVTARRELLFDEAPAIPEEMQHGWWRITTAEQLDTLMESLNPQGVRERNLLRNLQKNRKTLENVLEPSNAVDLDGSFFKCEPVSSDEDAKSNDANQLRSEIAREVFADITLSAKEFLKPNQDGTRGRSRKGWQAASMLNVKDMPLIEEFVEEAEEGDLERAKKLVTDVAFTLASRNVLKPPFDLVLLSENENENGEIYEFSPEFLRFISAIADSSTWSALKLRLVLLEFMASDNSLSVRKEEVDARSEYDDVVATCRQLLEALRSHDDSGPFQYPVNRGDYPSYTDVIKVPMDLQTIDNKLVQNCYRSINDFASDVRLIFSNCHLFNADGSEIFQQATRLKRWFERRFKQSSAA